MWIALAIIVSLVILLLAMNPKIQNTSRDGQLRRMNLETSSSYQQRTNHFQPPETIMGPMTGNESQHRVNLHQAYVT
jgi:hypothetical protein